MLEQDLGSDSDNLTKRKMERIHSDESPDANLVSKIVQLIEYYFSDDNVLRDKFLLKHIRRNKEGYVSVKLMSSYRKIKTLTKNWEVVAQSLKHSDKLEMNSEGNRVRRRVPLPELDKSAPSRSVVAYKFPFGKPTIEKIGTLFSSCGEISMIQLLRPGSNIPIEVRQLASKQPEVGREICALIEFEEELSMKKAMNIKNASVIPLLQSQDGNKKRKKSKPKPSTKVLTDSQTCSSSDNEKPPSSSIRRSSSVSSGYLSSSPRRDSDCDITLKSENQCALSSFGHYRRLEERRKSSLRQKLLDNIVRLPRGPDGTKGFRERHFHRSDVPLAVLVTA